MTYIEVSKTLRKKHWKQNALCLGAFVVIITIMFWDTFKKGGAKGVVAEGGSNFCLMIFFGSCYACVIVKIYLLIFIE